MQLSLIELVLKPFSNSAVHGLAAVLFATHCAVHAAFSPFCMLWHELAWLAINTNCL